MNRASQVAVASFNVAAVCAFIPAIRISSPIISVHNRVVAGAS